MWVESCAMSIGDIFMVSAAWHLGKLAVWHYKSITVDPKLFKFLFFATATQGCLSFFTIYVTKQTLYVQYDFLHNFLIQASLRNSSWVPAAQVL